MRVQDQTYKAPSFKSKKAYDIFNKEEKTSEIQNTELNDNKSRSDFYLKNESKQNSPKSYFN